MTPRTPLVIGALVLGIAGPAHADKDEKAEQLFRKGKRLLADKHYADACAAFEDSDRVDPGIGAKVNVARCYEEWGKLGTAWRWYADAERMALDAQDPRSKRVHALLAALEPDVPKLTIKLPPGASAANLALTLDGARLDASALGTAQRVDPGPHQIAYNLRGEPMEKTVAIERGGAVEIVLDPPAKRRTPRPGKHAPDGDEPEDQDGGGRGTGRDRRILGLAVTGAGAVALGVAGIVTLRARSDYHHALDAHCLGNKDKCDPVGLTAADNARHRANIATLVTIGGIAAVAGGLAIYFLAPHAASHDEHALYLAPDVAAGHGSLVFGGAF
jgi:hypothetical protein